MTDKNFEVYIKVVKQPNKIRSAALKVYRGYRSTLKFFTELPYKIHLAASKLVREEVTTFWVKGNNLEEITEDIRKRAKQSKLPKGLIYRFSTRDTYGEALGEDIRQQLRDIDVDTLLD